MSMTTSTDYSGRTVDLETLQTAETPHAVMAMAMRLNSGSLSRRITGMQKLAQRYNRLEQQYD